ncbi:MAG: M1 family metallopeptidase, partial [Deltaproteobacteria bacterium]|nr:M1 family metallopeptidase [Deltaproteobacteria bacterium]
MPTGFAVPTFTLLGQAVVRLPFIKDTSLGHEVLHAWFGNGVKVSRKDGDWAEGLTTYLADQAFALDQGRDLSFRKAQLVEYMSYVHEENAMPLKDFVGAGHTGQGVRARRAIGYGKGSMFFHMLKQRMGEEGFFEALREFYRTMKHRPAAWCDLLSSFERRSNKKMAGFFDQWLTRADIPGLGAMNLSVKEREGQQILSFLLVQKNDAPYGLDVPVTVMTARGEIRSVIHTTGSKTSVEIPLDASPTELVMDGAYDLMRELTKEELPAVWSRFLGASHKTAILSSPESVHLFGPLIDLLKKMNCNIIQ